MVKFNELPEFTQWAFIAAISEDENISNKFQSGQDIDIHFMANGVELDIEHVFQRIYDNMLSKVDERAKEIAVENSPTVNQVFNKLYHIQDQLNSALNYVDSAIQETYRG